MSSRQRCHTIHRMLLPWEARPHGPSTCLTSEGSKDGRGPQLPPALPACFVPDAWPSHRNNTARAGGSMASQRPRLPPLTFTPESHRRQDPWVRVSEEGPRRPGVRDRPGGPSRTSTNKDKSEVFPGKGTGAAESPVWEAGTQTIASKMFLHTHDEVCRCADPGSAV